MSTLAIDTEQIGSARRKLTRFAEGALARLRAQVAVRSTIAALHVSGWLLVLAIFVDRLFSLQALGISTLIVWGGISALAVPYVLWRTYTPRLHEKLAAVLADDRLRLDARLSTAMTLKPDEAAGSQFAAAFFQESVARLELLELAPAFPIQVPRSSALLLLPLLVAGGLWTLMPEQDAFGLVAEFKKKRQAEQAQERAAQSLKGKLEDMRQKITEQPKENPAEYTVDQLVKQAEAIARQMKEGQRSPEEAMAAMGELKRQIQQEREKLLDGKEFLDRLEKLSAKDLNLEEGDLTKAVSEALKNADPALASRQMRRLASQIKQDILDNPNLSAEQKQQQLEKLKDEVERLAGALADDPNLRQKLRELSEAAMKSSEFQGLAEQIRKFEEQNGKKQTLDQQMRQKVEDVADELDRMAEENDPSLNQAEQAESDQLDELEESVDEATDELNDDGEQLDQGGMMQGGQPGQKNGQAKPGGKKSGQKGQRGKSGQGRKGGTLGQKQAGSRDGTGQQGNNAQLGQGQGQQNGNPNGPPGPGLGSGKGSGHRPYRDGDAEFESQKLRGTLKQGAITGLSYFRGQGAKGEAPQEFKEALRSSEEEAASSLEMERIPVDARDVVKDYFSKVREGAGIVRPNEATTPAGAEQK